MMACFHYTDKRNNAFSSLLRKASLEFKGFVDQTCPNDGGLLLWVVFWSHLMFWTGIFDKLGIKNIASTLSTASSEGTFRFTGAPSVPSYVPGLTIVVK